MADYIDRKELLKKVNDVIKNGLGEQVSFSADGLKFLIDCLPSVDAVEVVRCEECKYKVTSSEYGSYCDKMLIDIKDNDFCKWGEKE